MRSCIMGTLQHWSIVITLASYIVLYNPILDENNVSPCRIVTHLSSASPTTAAQGRGRVGRLYAISVAKVLQLWVLPSISALVVTGKVRTPVEKAHLGDWQDSKGKAPKRRPSAYMTGWVASPRLSSRRVRLQ